MQTCLHEGNDSAAKLTFGSQSAAYSNPKFCIFISFYHDLGPTCLEGLQQVWKAFNRWGKEKVSLRLNMDIKGNIFIEVSENSFCIDVREKVSAK